MMPDWLFFLLVFAFGALLLGAGIAAYKGVYRGWMKREGYVFNSGFAMVPAGAMFLNLGAIGLYGNLFGFTLSSDSGTTLGLIAASPGLLAAIAVNWLPRCLLPKWYLDERDAFEADMRAQEMLAKQVKRARREARRRKRKGVVVSDGDVYEASAGMESVFVISGDSAAGWECMETAHVKIFYPSSFTRVSSGELGVGQVPGVDGVLASVEKDGVVFRPNLVVTSVPSTMPLVDAAYAAERDAVQSYGGASLINVDIVPRSTSDGVPVGRVMKFVYRRDQYVSVLVKKWVFATGAHHVHVTASYLPSQAAFIEQVFDAMMERAEFSVSDAQLAHAGSRWSENGTPLDGRSQGFGFPLEDLSEFSVADMRRVDPVGQAQVDVVAARSGIDISVPALIRINYSAGEQHSSYGVFHSRAGLLTIRSAGTDAYMGTQGWFEVYPLTEEEVLVDVLSWLKVRPQFQKFESMSVSLEEYNAHINSGESGQRWHELVLSAQMCSMRLVCMGNGQLYEAIQPDAGRIELALCRPDSIIIFILLALGHHDPSAQSRSKLNVNQTHSRPKRRLSGN